MRVANGDPNTLYFADPTGALVARISRDEMAQAISTPKAEDCEGCKRRESRKDWASIGKTRLT